MTANPSGRWERCFTPCAFEDKPCEHIVNWLTREMCGKPHTHYQRFKGSIQDSWPVRCDAHAI